MENEELKIIYKSADRIKRDYELRTEWVVFKKAGTYLPKTNLEILLKVFYFP